MQLANAAAGVVVLEHGAAACTRAQLERALGGSARARTRGR
jgi:bifunctional ADP-heptose synthase (sugar kinase/adenylyltransferase)